MRQAVVIIHGIGEQRPMETLRAFVAGALGVAAPTLANRVFSKPDQISDTLELRRLNVLPGPYGENYVLSKDCETDFYELYWQHLMQGAGWRPVLEWALYLLCHPRKLNTRLLAIWKRVAAIIVLVVVAIIVLGAVVWPALKISSPWLWAVGLAIFSAPLLVLGLRLLKWVVVGRVERFFLGFVGDAVRYLNPDPPNVEARRAIRTAGLTLLRGLHEDELRRYKRIILVGHSLGGVIAYDLITWFWQERHYRVELDRVSGERKTVATHPVETGRVANEDKSPLEELGDLSSISLETFREHQRALSQSLRKNGLPWRITDLVTLGSPLAHADVLLTDGKETLDLGKDQREFPTCPPSPEDERDDGLLSREYGEAEKRHEVRILHHGAPFAVTRWTNLYFPGDIIGGPVSHLLGAGIKDVDLSPDPNGGGVAHSWRSHIHYWDRGEKKASQELLAALYLNEAEKNMTTKDYEDHWQTRIKFASIRNDAYFADAHWDEEYATLFQDLPEGWSVTDGGLIDTPQEPQRHSWLLRHGSEEIAAVEHETGVEILVAIGVKVAATAIIAFTGWAWQRWRASRAREIAAGGKIEPSLVVESVDERFPDGSRRVTRRVEIRGPIQELEPELESALRM